MISASFVTRQASLSLALCAVFVGPAALAREAQCIVAGRLNPEGRWAPASKGVQFLDAAGQRLSSAGQISLSAIKAVRVAEPMFLSSCNAGQAMADGDATKGSKSSKSPAPALTAGTASLQVQAANTLPGRAGGQWVELRLDVPVERVVMLSR